MKQKRGSVVADVTSSNGNVFEDIGFGFEEAANLKIRSDLMIALVKWIQIKEYRQATAAEMLGVGRPEISDLQRGKVQKFSIDKLVTMLQKAGKNVSFQVVDAEVA